MSSIEFIDVIDEKNNIVRTVTKSEIYRSQLPHRVVHVMVVYENQIYITKRSKQVRYLPGYYCSSAAGHVQSGESPLEGAIRELKEEIGLSGPIFFCDDFSFIHEFRVQVSLFLKYYDPSMDQLKLESSEVEQGQFINISDALTMDQSSFHPQLAICIEKTKSFLNSKLLNKETL